MHHTPRNRLVFTAFTLLCLSVCIMTAHAIMSFLFPNSPTLPRVPMMSGSIGGAISAILLDTNLDTTDGTVKNARKLDGRSANQYMKKMSIGCRNITDILYGWDSIGNPDCRAKPGALASAPIGVMSESNGAVTIVRGSDGSSISATPGTDIFPGDTMSTIPSSTSTIAFYDSSIIRLGPGSELILNSGPTESDIANGADYTANAVLKSGTLWVRVLKGITIGGAYYIGTDDITVGVRGTSISLEKIGTQSNIMVVDSSETNATDVRCLKDNKVVLLQPEDSLKSNNGTCSLGAVKENIANKYSTTSWIRENTTKDIVYLANKRDSEKITDSASKVLRELNASLPKDTTECQGMTVSGSLDGQCGASVGNIDKQIGMACDDDTIKGSFFITAPLGERKCRESGLVGFADYSQSQTLYLKARDTAMGLLVPTIGSMTSASQPRLGYVGPKINSILQGMGWSIQIDVETSGSFGSYQMLLSMGKGDSQFTILLDPTGHLVVNSTPLNTEALKPATKYAIIMKKMSENQVKLTINGISKEIPVSYPPIAEELYIGRNQRGVAGSSWNGNIYKIDISR